MTEIEPRRIAIIQGHPDPAGKRLCHALADAYAEGAREGGHSVRRIETAALDFPILRTQEDFERGQLPPQLSEAWDAIRWANHLVIIFPLWLGTMPALLKAFLEHIARPGYAFEYVKDGFPKKMLGGRSARLVVTMGMPAFVYRLWYCAHALRAMERNILKFVGISPVKDTLIGMAGQMSEAKVRGCLDDMRKLGARGQ